MQLNYADQLAMRMDLNKIIQKDVLKRVHCKTFKGCLNLEIILTREIFVF